MQRRTGEKGREEREREGDIAEKRRKRRWKEVNHHSPYNLILIRSSVLQRRFEKENGQRKSLICRYRRLF